MDEGAYYEIATSFSYCIAAATAGVARCVHNGAFRSVGHCLSVAALAALLGLTVVVVGVESEWLPRYSRVGLGCLAGISGAVSVEILDILTGALRALKATVIDSLLAWIGTHRK